MLVAVGNCFSSAERKKNLSCIDKPGKNTRSQAAKCQMRRRCLSHLPESVLR